MKLLSSRGSKILLLVLISLLIFTGWQYGGELIYAKFLVGTTNVSLGIIKTDTHIEYVKKEGSDNKYQFKVNAVIDGRKGSYPQEVGGLLQPFVIILSWQIFMFFVINKKSAIISLVTNVVGFMFVQIIFLILLTGYYTSDIQQFIFTIMIDSFYIVALILIIKDNILYSVFGKQKVKDDNTAIQGL
jgi:hypothetical protein